MSLTLQATSPLSLLQRAQEALWAAEREETEERQKLNALKRLEQQFFLEVRRSPGNARRATSSVHTPQIRLDDLSRKREEFARRKTDQGKVVRELRERLHVARRTYEELQRHVHELQLTIRREERTVMQWQRQIKESEEQLARWQGLLTEAQARLEHAQSELLELAGCRAEGYSVRQIVPRG